MMTSQLIERTRAYVLENFLYARPDVSLADDEHLFERGIVDSLGVAELVVFVEREFAITVADDEVTEQNFCSLRAIADYVLAKQQGTTPVDEALVSDPPSKGQQLVA